MRLFDTHCHLDDEQFAGTQSAIVERAEAAGIVRLIAVGTTADSSLACVTMAAEFPVVLAAVGIHPNYVSEAQPGDWDRVVQLTGRPKVAALGETGLDRYWDHAPLDLQRDYFERHLRLSAATQLPFIVHMRDCETEMLEMLEGARRHGPLRGVMHSFTGSSATAEACLELGMYLSFAGMVTYKKSNDLRRVAAQVPGDRLLIETDAPYLSPHPKRGQRPNEPSLLVHTAACLAEVRGETLEALAERTTANACELFGGD
jgi:TatD DNase family protein